MSRFGPQLDFRLASIELATVRGEYVAARGAQREPAETALRIAVETELLALRELLDQIEEREQRAGLTEEG
jgi:hypothetical protein